MKRTWIWVLVAVVIVGLGVWVYFISRKPARPETVDTPTSEMSTTTEMQVATSTQPTAKPIATTTTTVKSTATSTASKPVPKQINPSPVWTQYLKAFACVQVTIPATTKVNSFRNEGMPVPVGTQTAYKCNNGHTWVY